MRSMRRCSPRLLWTGVATDESMRHNHRKAVRADERHLERQIARSARKLGARDYRPEQIEAALFDSATHML